ncbi:MAG TPA: hypothetical protein VF604_17385 [Pyrinomonadaceae bacterium]
MKNLVASANRFSFLEAAQAISAFSILITSLLLFESNIYGQKELDSAGIDPTFSTKLGVSGQVSKTIRQPDGKTIVAGDFEQVNVSERKNAVRLNSDDTVDASFNLAENVLGTYLEILPDGKFISVLSVPQPDASPKSTIVRLHADGSIDYGFNFARNITFGDFRFMPRSDGKVFAVGDFKVKRGKIVVAENFMLLDQFGGMESNFNVNVTGKIRDAFPLPNGKMAIVGAFEVKRLSQTVGKNFAVLNENGSLDPAFDLFFGVQSESVSGVSVQPDGKLLVYGSFSQVYKQNGFGRQILKSKGIARLNTDGSLDSGFITPFSSASIGKILLQPDGKIIGIGDVLAPSGFTQRSFFRLFSDGSLDAVFGNNLPTSFFGQQISKIELLADGRIFMSGKLWLTSQTNHKKLMRLNADGTLDQTFQIPEITGGAVDGFDLQPDGRILAYGNFGKANGQSRVSFARFNSFGAPDENFRYAFVRSYGVNVKAAARQADGKYLIAGDFSVVNGEYVNNPEYTYSSYENSFGTIVRLNQDGSLDSSFAPFTNLMDELCCVVVQPDGKVLIGGNIRPVVSLKTYLVRLNADGTKDTSFNRVPIETGGDYDSIETLRLQPDGKILVGGFFERVGGVEGRNLVRFNADGSFERFFPASQYHGSGHMVEHLIIQPDGKIIGGGLLPRLPRFNADGTLDMSFRWTDYQMAVFTRAMQLEPDGKILFSGQIGSGLPGEQPFYPQNLYRMNQNGEIETQFNMQAHKLLSLADGKFIVGNYIAPQPSYRLAGFFPNGNADDSFNVLFDRQVNNLMQQPDGKIMAVGEFRTVNGVKQVGLTRLNP